MKYHVNCEHSLQSDTELCKTIDVCECDPHAEPFKQRTGGLILTLSCSKKADGSGNAMTYKLTVDGTDYTEPFVFSPDKNPKEEKVEALDVSTPGGGGGGDTGALHRRRRLLQDGGNES